MKKTQNPNPCLAGPTQRLSQPDRLDPPGRTGRQAKSNINPKSQISCYEGFQENVRGLKTPRIDAWENKYSDRWYVINLETAEFTCICPKTGLPDFATIKIEYSPAKWCVELKSFKEYLIFYRDLGIFHEHAINRILYDFVKACNPRWARVAGEFNARGGIKTTVSANYKR